jgi:hypothetical protein
MNHTPFTACTQINYIFIDEIKFLSVQMTADNSKREIKKMLTPLQFHVTQQCGTEPPFQNEFWNNKRPASMWMWYQANLYSARWTNSTLKQAGRASPGP